MMKVLVVLMLVCSVYANEIKTLSDQQPCLQDVHAALREITASLAKQEVEMKYLQAENREQAAKLDKQEDQLQDQQTEVEKLKKQLQGKQVAFSASLVASIAQTFGPFSKDTTLVFKHVVTNIGNAYNSHTGVFTAPLKGAYHFEWYVYNEGGRPTGAVLVKNSEIFFLAYESQQSGGQSASNGVTLLLEAGDAVFLRQWRGSAVIDNVNHHTTFSGHLLFTM